MKALRTFVAGSHRHTGAHYSNAEDHMAFGWGAYVADADKLIYFLAYTTSTVEEFLRRHRLCCHPCWVFSLRLKAHDILLELIGTLEKRVAD